MIEASRLKMISEISQLERKGFSKHEVDLILARELIKVQGLEWGRLKAQVTIIHYASLLLQIARLGLNSYAIFLWIQAFLNNQQGGISTIGDFIEAMSNLIGLVTLFVNIICLFLAKMGVFFRVMSKDFYQR
jgi:hypothetical protein